MGGFGFEALAHDGEQVGEGLDRDFSTVLVEDFDEATHVGALDLGREVDGKAEGGRHLLGLLGAVEDGDGIPEVTDSDAVEGHAPFVDGVLKVGESRGGRTGGGCAHERGTFPRAAFFVKISMVSSGLRRLHGSSQQPFH